MNDITIDQIVSAIGSVTAIAVFFIAIFKWYKNNFTNKFAEIDNKFDEVNNRLNEVESRVERREKEFLRELNDSKFERKILLRGELAALKGLAKMGCVDDVTESVSEIEDYMMDRTHNMKGR